MHARILCAYARERRKGTLVTVNTDRTRYITPMFIPKKILDDHFLGILFLVVVDLLLLQVKGTLSNVIRAGKAILDCVVEKRERQKRGQFRKKRVTHTQ